MRVDEICQAKCLSTSDKRCGEGFGEETRSRDLTGENRCECVPSDVGNGRSSNVVLEMSV